MTETTLAATVRQGTGKGVARKLRQAGQVPAIIYGIGEPVSIQCDAHDAQMLVQHLHGSERLISLKLADQAGKTVDRHVLLKDVQSTPVGARLLHIDFYEVDVTQKVHVAVDVHAEGHAIGERDGGILQQVTYQVSVECLPTAIPDSLSLDVSMLNIGDSLHVSDLQLPAGVETLTPEDETLFVVAAPRLEEVAEEAEGEEALAADEVPTTAEDEAKEEAEDE